MSKTDAESGTQLNRLRLRVFDLLEPAAPSDFWSKATDAMLIALILANVLAFSLDTVPALHAAYGTYFDAFMLASAVVFTIELILRVWSSVEILHGEDISYFRRRLKFVLRPMQLIDIAVVASFWLVFFVPYDLRALRAIRILSFLRMARYSASLAALSAAVKTEKRALASAMVLMVAAVVICGSVMHLLEGAAQPEAFGNVFQAYWYSLVSVSTVGYGDSYPVTLAGKMFGSVVIMFGVGLAAVLVGVVSASFVNQANKRDFIDIWNHLNKVPLFTGTSVPALQAITDMMQRRDLKAGEVLFEIGDALDSLVIVAEGKLLVEGDGFRQLFGRGSSFGELALIADRKAKARISADSDARILVLCRSEFQGMLDKQAEVRNAVKRMARLTDEGKSDRLVTQAA